MLQLDTEHRPGHIEWYSDSVVSPHCHWCHFQLNCQLYHQILARSQLSQSISPHITCKYIHQPAAVCRVESCVVRMQSIFLVTHNHSVQASHWHCELSVVEGFSAEVTPETTKWYIVAALKNLFGAATIYHLVVSGVTSTMEPMYSRYLKLCCVNIDTHKRRRAPEAEMKFNLEVDSV